MHSNVIIELHDELSTVAHNFFDNYSVHSVAAKLNLIKISDLPIHPLYRIFKAESVLWPQLHNKTIRHCKSFNVKLNSIKLTS